MLPQLLLAITRDASTETSIGSKPFLPQLERSFHIRFRRQKVFQRTLHRDGTCCAVCCAPLIELTLKGAR